MAAEEADIVAEWQQLAMDGGEQRGMVAIFEIRPPDGPAEQHIPDQRDAQRLGDEDDMTRGMARAVQHGEILAGDLHPVTFHQPAVRGDVAPRQIPSRRRLFQPIEQDLVAPVRPLDRHGGTLCRGQGGAQLIRAGGVVGMAMGEQDALDRDLELAQRGEDSVDLSPWINDNAPHCPIIPQHGAVLLEGGDRDDGGLEGHGGGVLLCSAGP